MKALDFTDFLADIAVKEDAQMRSLTKSTLGFARTAFRIAKQKLPAYSCPKSPHKFTQPQLFAILAIRTFLKTDYRGIVQTLSEWSELRGVLELRSVPHYSTLCYAEKRLLKKGASANSSMQPLRSLVTAA